MIMGNLRSVCVCSCSVAIAAAMLATQAAAEPVQTAFTVDANTTALYLFKEGTGTTSVCEKAGVPAATFVSGAAWVPGRQYFAVATDSGYMTVADNAALRPVTAITVEAWVKLQRPAGDLIVKEQCYFFRIGSTIMADFAVGGTKWTTMNGNLPVPTGQWTHLAITFNSVTHTGCIYINGVLDTTTTFATGTMNPSTSTLWLGRNDYDSGSNVDGKIDSIRISNIARVFTPLYPTPPEPPTPKGNLVPNGDFEIGLTGWRGDTYGDINLVWETTSGAATGQKCVHSIAGANPQAGLYSRPIPAHPGRHYTFSGQFMSTTSSSYSPRFEVLGIGSGAGFVSYGPSDPLYIPGMQNYPTAPAGSWRQTTYSFTLPTNFTSPSLCVHIGYPSSGNICVDDVRLIATDGMTALALKDKIAVGLQSLPVGNLYTYTPNATTATTLIISNTDTVAHNVTVQPTITDWQENPVSGQPSLGTFSVPAGSAITATYGMNTALRGTFRLGFDLTSEGQTWHQSAEAKYAVFVNMQNVGNPDTSMFGMNTHMEREPTAHLAREMQVLSKCGVKWVRAWWGWGMCENPMNTYNWTEYDRQYSTVTTGTGIRIMPILLRYDTKEITAVGTFSEWAWAGTTPSGGMQQPPFTSMMDQWGLFCGKVAQRYAGNIKAYELWNEPGVDDHGTVTVSVYTTLLNETRPNIRKAGNDPNAMVIGFAGPAISIASVLANGTAGQMDAVSLHAYGQLLQPETGLPAEVSSVRATMTAGGCPTSMPIWHTEQGISADGDGYKAKSLSEADVAQLYTRNVITSAAQGSQRYFWFSSDDTAEYGATIFYGDYVPRPRLGALAACASFIEGTTFKKTYNPDSNTYAHLFQGPSTGVCVFWNRVTPMQLILAINPSKLQAFDTMGNAIPITGATTSTVQVGVERPTFLQCNLADYSAMDTAVSGATVSAVCTVNVATTPIVGGVRVTLTGASPTPVDGIVDLIAAAGTTPKGWPAAQHFQGLALGQSQSYTFAVPAKAGISQVRVRCGDRRMITTTVVYKAH
jgi:hypothetical protein